MEFLKRYKWVIVGIGAVGLIVAFLLFRPDKLFVDDVVDESLADAFPVTQTDEAAVAPTTTTTLPPPTTLPPSSDGGSTETTATTLPPTTTTTEPAGPQAIATGSIFGIDHEAEGTATVYELDGDFVLRFEDDTDIQNGPDLFVYFLPAADYEKGDSLGDFINLGKLKGNVGGQNYELPAEFDPEVHRFVMIWCERFDVPFAASPLA